jgi:hypothetical protein
MGASPEEMLGDPAPEGDMPTTPPIAETAPNASQRWVAWAEDVHWVYEHHAAKLAKSSPGMTTARWGILQYARKNMDAFMAQLVPKAMTVLEKAHDKTGDTDAVVIEEKRGIAELKRILVAAIAESQQAA